MKRRLALPLRRTQHQCRAAFTLIELLVVIGIIAILVGIILPSVISVRRQANLVKCGANLRSITQAALLHAQDHRGFLPLAGQLQIDQPTDWGVGMVASSMGDPGRQRYSYALAFGTFVVTPLPASLAPYLSTIKLDYNNWYTLDQQLNDNRGVWQFFMCPATDAMERHRLGVDETTLVGQGTLMVLTRAGVVSHLWSTNSDFGINEGVFGFDYRTSYQSRRLAGNLSRIKRPSELMLFGDANPASIVDPLFAATFQYPWLTFAPSDTATSAVTLGDAFAQNSNVLPNRARFDKTRHKNRINIVFADAHVETLNLNAAELQRVHLTAR